MIQSNLTHGGYCSEEDEVTYSYIEKVHSKKQDTTRQLPQI
jgi:hypothetical protein